MDNCVINNVSFTGNCLEHEHSWSACQKITFVAPWKNSADDILMTNWWNFSFSFFLFFFSIQQFFSCKFSQVCMQCQNLAAWGYKKKNISEGGLLIIFTQHAKGLSTGAEKKSIPTVTSDVKYMIKGTGLPAWSVFIAAVDFFHNKKI